MFLLVLAALLGVSGSEPMPQCVDPFQELLTQAGDRDETERAYLNALNTLGPDHVDTALAAKAHGEALAASTVEGANILTGDTYAPAEAAFSQCVNVLSRHGSSYRLELGECERHLAVAIDRQQRPEEAAPHFTRALSLLEPFINENNHAALLVGLIYLQRASGEANAAFLMGESAGEATYGAGVRQIGAAAYAAQARPLLEQGYGCLHSSIIYAVDLQAEGAMVRRDFAEASRLREESYRMVQQLRGENSGDAKLAQRRLHDAIAGATYVELGLPMPDGTESEGLPDKCKVLRNAASPVTLCIEKFVIPKYPDRARGLDVEGFVILTHDVGLDGKPTNIRIRRSEPEGVFDNVSLTAVKKWRFAPPTIENGSPTVAHDVPAYLPFRLTTMPLEMWRRIDRSLREESGQ